MARTYERVFGADLRPGDAIKVWMQSEPVRITSLAPYSGPLAYLFKEGASIAQFDVGASGMTIDHGAIFDRVVIPA